MARPKKRKIRSPAPGSNKILAMTAVQPEAARATGNSIKTERTSTSLLDIPPELRVQVYDHLFEALRSQSRNATSLESYTAATFPGLMRSSSSLRKEATPQYRQHLLNLHADLGKLLSTSCYRKSMAEQMYVIEYFRPRPNRPYEQVVEERDAAVHEYEALSRELDRVVMVLKAL